MAKYDILDKFVDMAGKWRLIVENTNTNDLINLKFDHDPKKSEIKASIDPVNDRRETRQEIKEEIDNLKNKRKELADMIDYLQWTIDNSINTQRW